MNSATPSHYTAVKNSELPSSSAERDKRERLILSELPRVRMIARRIHRRLYRFVSLDDLVSAGILGLIAAVDSYDVAFEVPFKGYSEYRISGAILDSMRKLDWVPRNARLQARKISQAVATLQQQLQRSPQQEEIASYLGVSVSKYQQWEARCLATSIGSLEGDGTEARGVDFMLAASEPEEKWPSGIVEREQIERVLQQALKRIPRRWRTVLTMYYYEDLTTGEIGEILDLHQSRISQLKTRAVLELRTYIEDNLGLRNRGIIAEAVPNGGNLPKTNCEASVSSDLSN